VLTSESYYKDRNGHRSSLTSKEKIYSINMRPPKWFITIFDVAFNNPALL
jgi:hypothetical protein